MSFKVEEPLGFSEFVLRPFTRGGMPLDATPPSPTAGVGDDDPNKLALVIPPPPPASTTLPLPAPPERVPFGEVAAAEASVAALRSLASSLAFFS